MLYGKAGGAWTSGDVSSTTNADAGTPTTSSDTSRFGWMLGAGAEHMLSREWSVKAEYDYLRFGGSVLTPAGFLQTVPSPDPTTLVPVASTGTNFSQETHLLKVGLNYRLGGSKSAADAVVESPTAPLAGATLEIGARYVYGWGRFQKDLGIPGEGLASLASRLTYSGMNTTGGELFARADLPNGLVAKGFIGSGNGDGRLNDEDWGLSGPPFASSSPIQTPGRRWMTRSATE